MKNQNLCPNCGTPITCSCQKRVTAKGKVGCTKCIKDLMKSNNNSKNSTEIFDILYK